MILELDRVSRVYGANRALDGVSLGLGPGEVHALMGENGAGKSTLIRLVAGVERPDGGTLRMDGAPLALTGAAAAAAAGIRVLHQELSVAAPLSVAENMHLGRTLPTRLGLVDWRALRRQARAALAAIGADHVDPAARMGSLAPGDQMLVRVAALQVPGAAPARVYVLDEPTAAMTAAESERLFAALRGLCAAGAAVLYVSHRLAEVLALADRISVLRDGRLVSSRPRADTDAARLVAEMTGSAAPEAGPALPPPQAGPARLLLAGLRVGALGPLDLEVAAGEVLGVAGLQGAFELVRALAGGRARGGAALLDGAPLAATPAGAWAQGVAHVPAERRAEGVMLERAAAETMLLPHLGRFSRFGLLPPRRLAHEAAQLAGAVHLRPARPAAPVRTLSGGNQQKLLFARALAARPRLLLLEEPTRGVDVGARAELHALVRQMAASGAAVVLASTDLPELLALSHRVAVLRGGGLGAILPASGLTEAALLVAMQQQAAA